MLRPLDAQRPVVFFTNGIGDAFLNLPSLRALSKLFPRKLTLICDANSYQLCFSALCVSVVLVVRRWEEQWDITFDAVRLRAAVGGCDLFISLVPWHSDSVQYLLKSLAPKMSIGFFPAFDIAIPRDYGKHTADLAFEIPRYFEPTLLLEDYAGPPEFHPDVEKEVEQIRSHVPAGFRMLAVHADTVIEKMWSAARFVSVLDVFLTRHPTFLAFAVGEVRQRLDTGYMRAHILPAYGLSLAVSCCLVSHADLFLGIDSCMLHVADLCRVPGVGLFGPTSSHEFGFRFGVHRHVCILNEMEDISVPAVIESMESLVRETEKDSKSFCCSKSEVRLPP